MAYAGLGWAAVGALVWVGFAFFGGPRAVPGMKGSSIAFRLMILPGVALLWPLVLLRWARWSKAAAAGTTP
ncbi:MAG: hypothetical protein H6719_07330 [Sandaracinaceae bacterium]|nr:hypothetical protein [Sandaracinaceae bacterium]